MNPIAIITAAVMAIVGQPAPDISVKDVKGKEVSLASFKGKTVVLEWTNFGCPFVRKHYDSGNMQKLQETYTGKDVIWLTVSSSAKGTSSYVAPDALAAAAEKEKTEASHVLVDDDGKLGKAFGAKVTPHMFIINKAGMVVYDGAIDSKKTTDTADVKTATPLFENALKATIEGKEVEMSKNEPYGCGVKY